MEPQNNSGLPQPVNEPANNIPLSPAAPPALDQSQAMPSIQAPAPEPMQAQNFPTQAPQPPVIAAPALASQPNVQPQVVPSANPGGAPLQPTMAPATSPPQGGFVPAPFTPINPVNKKPTKLIIIITSVVVALVALGGVAFFVMSKSFTLHEVTGSNYSILVPTSFEKTTDTSGDKYMKKGTSASDTGSSISVGCKVDASFAELDPADRSKAVSMLKDDLEKSVKDGSISDSSAGKYEFTNVVSNQTTSSGDEAIDITASVRNKDSNKKGSMALRMLIAKPGYCAAWVTGPDSEKLMSKSDQIIKSFQTKF